MAPMATLTAKEAGKKLLGQILTSYESLPGDVAKLRKGRGCGTLLLKKEEETDKQLQVFCKYYHIFFSASLTIIFLSLDECNLFYPNS